MQLDLLFDAPRKVGRGPQVIQSQVDEFIRRLSGNGWMNSASLGAVNEKQKRVLRALAAASGGHIISGQEGYRLNCESTGEDVRVAVNKLKNQIAEEQRRVVEIERVYHARLMPECLRVN